MMSRGSGGILIAVEGIDAVGKKTQSSLLASWLTSKGLTQGSFSFPDYGTTIGKEIKRFLVGTVSYPPEVRAMLYAANRWENKGKLESARSGFDATIVNRYSGSNFAYGLSNGLNLQWLVNLEAGLPKPDLILLLDAPPSLLLPRRRLNKDTYETDLGLQERARAAYLGLAKEFGWKVVDATKGIDETNRTITSMVTDAFAIRGRTV
jgi:dTMP kinase